MVNCRHKDRMQSKIAVENSFDHSQSCAVNILGVVKDNRSQSGN